MKIAPKAAQAFLAQPEKTSAGLLLYGPDAGLARERMHAAAAAFLGAGADEFSRLELSDAMLKEDPSRLADELAAMSLLGGKRVILLRDAGDKLAKTVEAALPFAGGLNYLIVCAGELGPRSSLRQLFESHAKLAALPCYKDEAMDLQAVIAQRFGAAGITAEREATAYLCAHLGNDRGVTAREIEKIILYLGEEKKLTLQAAENLVAHNRDVELDGLCADLAGGQAARVSSLVVQALREGTSAVALLRAAQRYFQRLYQVKEAQTSGTPLDQAVAALRPPLFFKNVAPFTAHAKTWEMPRIVRALELLCRAEAATKKTGASPALLADRAFLEVSRLAAGAAPRGEMSTFQ